MLRVAAMVALIAILAVGAFALGRATVHAQRATRVIVVPTTPTHAPVSGTLRCGPSQHAC
jgi:hypothetical protein